MRRIFKWLLAIIVVLIVVIGAALLLVDPNQFKPQIEQKVTDITGREFSIDGPISWQLFPTVGIELEDVKLMNPKGYPDKPTAQLGELDLSLAVMPLLSGDLQVGDITLKGAHVNIIKRAGGRSNLDGLSGQEQSKTTASESDSSSSRASESSHQESTSTASADKGLSDLSIAGVNISDLQLVIQDETIHATQSIQLQSLKLGQFQLGKAADFSFVVVAKAESSEASLSGKGKLRVDSKLNSIQIKPLALSIDAKGDSLPNQQVTGDINGDIDVTLDPLVAKINLAHLNLDKIEGKGQVSANLANKPDLQLSLSLDTIDLNRYLTAVPANDDSSHKADKSDAAAQSTTAAKSTSTKNGGLSDEEPDLSALQSFNGQLDININKILYREGEVGPVHFKANVKDGVASIPQAAVELYKGKIDLTAKLDSRPKRATYQSELTLKNIDVLPPLRDFADLKILSGTVNSQLHVDGVGLSPLRLQRDSAANGDFEFTNGAYHGINVAQLIRDTYARIKGKKVDSQDQQKTTDFTALSGKFNKKGYTLTNSTFDMQSPLLRVHGYGNYRLDNSKVNYQTEISVVGSLEGQGGKTIDDLKNITIPLKISGTVPDDIKYKLQLDEVLKQQAKQELEKQKQKLKKKADKEKDKLKDKIEHKVQDKLHKLLGGLHF